MKQAFLKTNVGYIVENDLGRRLNLRQEKDGYSVTVKRAYVNSELFIIGMILEMPEGVLRGDNTMIRTNYGDEFYGGGLRPIMSQQQGHKTIVAEVAFLNVSGLRARPKDPESDLRVEDMQVTLPPLAHPHAAGTPTPVEPDRAPPTFHFSFSVPFVNDAVVVAGDKQPQGRGVTLALEEVRIAGDSTRAVVQHSPLDEKAAWWDALVAVTPGWDSGGEVPANSWATERLRWTSSSSKSFDLPLSLYHKPGKWTLTIVDLAGDNGSGHKIHVPGQWTFKFEVPEQK